jgi:hypothetical protein
MDNDNNCNYNMDNNIIIVIIIWIIICKLQQIIPISAVTMAIVLISSLNTNVLALNLNWMP